jgi:protein O-mannosyl-transferase
VPPRNRSRSRVSRAAPTSAPTASPPFEWRTALWLLVPLALTVLAYWRTLNGEFQFDDTHTVERNLAVKDLGGFLRRGFVDSYYATGRPLTDLTFALNYATGRLNPWNFHLTSLIIHLLTVVLVWAFTRAVLRLAGAARVEWTAVAVAGIFSLHPMQSQAVAYVSQRAEVLSSAFYVAALLALLTAERRPPRSGAAWVVLAFVLFAVGLGAKSIVITLPAAWLLVVELAPSPEARARRWPTRLRWLAAAPFLVFGAYYSQRTVGALTGHSDAGFSVPGYSPFIYFITQWRVLVTYLRLLVWPAGQNVDWDIAPSRGLLEPEVLLSGLTLLALVGLAVWLVRRGYPREGPDGAASRLAGVGLLWFFVLLSVTSSFIPLADVLMEHRIYLASWGPILAGAVGVERLLARVKGPRPAVVAAAVVAAAWALPAAALHARNAVWETQRSLWTDASLKSPNNPRVWLSLAHAAMMEGNLEESVRTNLEALRHATRVDMQIQILRNLGAGQLLLGRTAEADATLRRAVAMAPYEADLLNNLAATLAEEGHLDEAESFARRATESEPNKSEGWATLGDIAMRRGDPARALPFFEHSLALDPDVPLRHYNRAVALLRLGRAAEACRVFRQIATLPVARRDPQLRSRLGAALHDPACAAVP